MADGRVVDVVVVDEGGRVVGVDPSSTVVVVVSGTAAFGTGGPTS